MLALLLKSYFDASGVGKNKHKKKKKKKKKKINNFHCYTLILCILSQRRKLKFLLKKYLHIVYTMNKIILRCFWKNAKNKQQETFVLHMSHWVKASLIQIFKYKL